MKKANIEELKNEYVGKTFNWLTIIDVFRLENSDIKCKCTCICGNTKIAALRKVRSGHTKSCGCYIKSKEHSLKLSKALKDHEVSRRISEGVSNWYKNNPDLVKQKAENFKQWCKDNSDKLKEIGRKNSEWAKNNSDKIALRTEKTRQFYRDHPEKMEELSAKKSAWYKNNPEKAQAKIEKYKQWRKCNQDKVFVINSKISQWYKDNPDLLKHKTSNQLNTYNTNRESNVELLKLAHTSKRVSSIQNLNFYFVHPDDIHYIYDGANSHTKIRALCPNCNEYSTHQLNRIINYRDKLIKSIPLCPRCAKSFTTSKYESEIAEYISTFYSGDLIRNSREIISPLELDLYYPNKKIAIEFNGDYFHSDNYKSADYHLNKYLLCRSKDILLVSIFETFWNNRKDEVKLYLKDLFSNVENSLSFSDDQMNNNYPSPLLHNKEYVNIVPDLYYAKNSVIHTCGYSEFV
jgi:hypothetical protein